MNTAMLALRDEYLRRKEAAGVSRGTLKNTGYKLRLFLDFLAERKLAGFDELEAKDIRFFMLFLRAKRRNGKRIYSVRYIYSTFRQVKRFLDFLTVKQIINANPAEYVALKPPSSRLPRDILTEGEIKKLQQAMSSPALLDRRNSVIFELIYHTGLRSGEVRNLNIYDLDFKESLLYVRTGKGGRNRVVPLNDYIREILEQYIRYIRPECRIERENYDALFVNTSGRRIRRDDISGFIHEYTARTNITKKISAHSIRHTFATHMLKNGAGVRYIQEILGHEFLSTTEIYTRVVPIDLRDVIDRYHPRNNELSGEFAFPDIERLPWSACHVNRIGRKYKPRAKTKSDFDC